jgi:hypothetical protein
MASIGSPDCGHSSHYTQGFPSFPSSSLGTRIPRSSASQAPWLRFATPAPPVRGSASLDSPSGSFRDRRVGGAESPPQMGVTCAAWGYNNTFAARDKCVWRLDLFYSRIIGPRHMRSSCVACVPWLVLRVMRRRRGELALLAHEISLDDHLAVKPCRIDLQVRPWQHQTTLRRLPRDFTSRDFCRQ